MTGNKAMDLEDLMIESGFDTSELSFVVKYAGYLGYTKAIQRLDPRHWCNFDICLHKIHPKWGQIRLTSDTSYNPPNRFYWKRDNHQIISAEEAPRFIYGGKANKFVVVSS